MNDCNHGLLMKTGKSTFLVKILFRQNASWQGTIQWLDGKKTRSFRSALELINLIQEAADMSESPRADGEFHSWSDSDDALLYKKKM